MKFLLTVLLLSLSFTVVAQTPPAEDVPVRQAGSYKVGEDMWSVLIIPPGVSKERLISMAKNLHEAARAIRYHFFDNDEEVVKFLMSKRGISSFPEKWFNKHHVGSLQTMAYDRSVPRWYVLAGDTTKIADLGPESLPATPVQPAAVPSSSETPAFFDPAGEVKTEYDRFEAKTKISLNNALVAGKHLSGLYLMAYAERRSGSFNPETIVLGFKAITPLAGAYFPAAPKLDALIDGEPVSMGHMTRIKNEDLVGVLNVEMYGLSITPADLARLVNAKTIEMRLNTTEFKFTEHHQELLRQFQTALR